MAKPIHEQEWKIRNTNHGPILDVMSGHPGGESVCMVYAPMSYGAQRLTLAESDAIRDARAAAIAALPDMARALLMWLPENGHTAECGSPTDDERACSLECSTTRKVLRRAGVLP